MKKKKKQLLNDTKDVLEWIEKNPKADAKEVDNFKKKNLIRVHLL